MLSHPLAREVAIVVAIKTAIVIAAALFVFGPKQRPVVDAAAVEALIVPPLATIPEVRSTADE
jgi:hypothetical protein